MPRSGLYASGVQLAKSERIEALVEPSIFEDARKVIASLQPRNCSTLLHGVNRIDTDSPRQKVSWNSSSTVKWLSSLHTPTKN